MEIIIGLIAIAILLFMFLRGSAENTGRPDRRQRVSNQNTTKKVSKEERILEVNDSWMKERWGKAEIERESGELSSVPCWFFDEVTERQLKKMAEIGLNISGGTPTKGQASDIIGLFESAEEENIEILKFFKIPIRNMNNSRARYEVEKIFRTEENFEKWKKRPASPMQKEFYKFFGLKTPKGVTYESAKEFISDYLSELSESDESKADEWEMYEDIYDEINEPDFREDYNLKKISISAYRTTIDQLKKSGIKMIQLSDDPYIVADKIVEIKPELQKN